MLWPDLAVQNLVDFLGVDRDGDRIRSRCRKEQRATRPRTRRRRASFLPRDVARLGRNRNIFSHFINSYGLSLVTRYTNNVLTEPSSWMV